MFNIRIAVRREKLPRVRRKWRLAGGLALAVAGETAMALQVGFVRFLLASKVSESLS